MAASPDRVPVVDVGGLAPGTNETPGAKLTTLAAELHPSCSAAREKLRGKAASPDSGPGVTATRRCPIIHAVVIGHEANPNWE
jgi:hypothetical protein